MNRRGTELGFNSIVMVILFAVVAFIVLSLVFSFYPIITGGLSDSICKINVFFRAATLGNPVVETLLGAVGTLTGGFGGAAVSLMSVPLACYPGPAVDYTDYVTLDVLTRKVMDESIRCWDVFGEGRWDPLVMYEGGNQFTCFEQTIDLKCDSLSDGVYPQWIKNMYEEYEDIYDSLTESGGSIIIDQVFLNRYADTHFYSIGDIQKRYSDLLGAENPFLGFRGILGYNMICDGKKRKYVVGLYYIDQFFQAISRVKTSTETLCYTVSASASADQLILCTYDVSTAVVT